MKPITTQTTELSEGEQNLNKVMDKIKTYSRDWRSYNLAQTYEKRVCISLMEELTGTVRDFYYKRTGRPTFPLKDLLMCMFTYVYNNFSSRRTMSDIYMLKKGKIISKVPCFTTLLNGFKDSRMTKLLSWFITMSSLPMKPYEKQFAVDSSGFSTSIFERWFNVRTQRESKLRHWKKAHLLVGTATCIIVNVKITDGTGADCPEMIPLVKKVRKLFDMEEVSADKAYLSRENLEGMARLGIFPLIPFKKNSTSLSKGHRIWNTLFYFFYSNYDKFAEMYHRRSLIETVNHMIKSKFSHKLKTKTNTSQINEILMKCLCHNLAVLVTESFKNGLKIDFSFCAKDHPVQKERGSFCAENGFVHKDS